MCSLSMLLDPLGRTIYQKKIARIKMIVNEWKLERMRSINIVVHITLFLYLSMFCVNVSQGKHIP